MHPITHRTRRRVRKAILATALAAAVLTACATQRLHDGRRSAAVCPLTAVLYCEADVHLGLGGAQCRCVRHGEVRDALRSLSRR